MQLPQRIVWTLSSGMRSTQGTSQDRVIWLTERSLLGAMGLLLPESRRLQMDLLRCVRLFGITWT